MIERTVYECEHCHKKRLINKTQMKKHEDICWYNTKNKTCLTCSNYIYESAHSERHDELEYPCYESIPEVRYCEVKHEDMGKQPKVNCELWNEREEC